MSAIRRSRDAIGAWLDAHRDIEPLSTYTSRWDYDVIVADPPSLPTIHLALSDFARLYARRTVRVRRTGATSTERTITDDDVCILAVVDSGIAESWTLEPKEIP